MSLDAEKKALLVELLGEAEPGDLPEGFAAQSTIAQRLTRQKEGYETALAEQQARYDELMQDRNDKAAALSKFEDKDKTAEQLYAQQLAAEEEKRAAWERKAAEATSLAEQRYDALKSKALRELVSDALAGTKIKPAYAPAALREALAENKLSAVDNDGQFSLQVTVDGLPADNPAEAIGQWWQKRTDLHEVKGAPSPSPGAGAPPGDPPPKDILEGKSPGYQQFAAALATEKAVTVPMAEE